MNFLKNNKKLIAGIAIGVLTTTGIGYAANNYLAGDIRYTKSGASSSISVADALNELYDMKKNYILPSGTIPITTKGNQIDVKNYQYADTSGMYTGTEYQNYGNAQYQAGLNANADSVANSVGYKVGIYTSSGTEKKYINCGFKPKLILIDLAGTDGNSLSVFYSYDERFSTTQSFRRHINEQESNWNFTMENDGAIVESSLHIYKVDSSGFGFYFNKARTIYWIAFK